MTPYRVGSIIKLISRNPKDDIVWVGIHKEHEFYGDFLSVKIGTFGIILDLPNKDNQYKILFGNRIGFVPEQSFMAA